MKILISEDDLNSRKLMKSILSDYGACEIAVDGEKAVQAVGIDPHRETRFGNCPCYEFKGRFAYPPF